jgi:glutathione S-transferase
MMKLHWSPRSPYVRKVMVVAHELGLAGRIEAMRTIVGGTQAHLELMRENPLGKIPTLVLEDGTILYDSPVICEYLDTLHNGPKLFPTWPQRLTALRRLALGDGMLDIALAWLGERFRPPERQSEPHMTLWRTKLRACIDALENEALDGPLTIGHIAIGIALSYLDFRFADLAWRDGHPRLTAWHATFDQRPSMLANPPIDDR